MVAPLTDVHTIDESLKAWGTRFDAAFDALLQSRDGAPAPLVDAMRYSALASGKRLRPFVLTRFCELGGGHFDLALPAAAAIECVHAFSLVHDDLPAMDNDDLRRGKPTAHKQFGEAMAILAGDGLLALAFELITGFEAYGERAGAIALELARGTGWAGMVGGQVADALGEKEPPSQSLVAEIHTKKTAALFASACRMGAICCGSPSATVEAAGEYGKHLGLTFQIADDLLDVTATAEQMGKNVRKDAGAGKQTYPSAVGIDGSRRAADELADTTVQSLSSWGAEADDLRALAMFAIQRQH